MVVFSKCILRGLSILKFQVGHSKQIIKAKIIKLQNFTATVVIRVVSALETVAGWSLVIIFFAAIIWLWKQFFWSYHGICHISQLFWQITVQFREGHKTLNKYPSKFWHYWATTKLNERFFKFLWPSQKTSSLTMLVHSFALAKSFKDTTNHMILLVKNSTK